MVRTGVAVSAWVTRKAAFVGVNTTTAPKRGSKRARRASTIGVGKAGSMKTPGGGGVGVGGTTVGEGRVGVGGMMVGVGKYVTATGGGDEIGAGAGFGVEAQAASASASPVMLRNCRFDRIASL